MLSIEVRKVMYVRKHGRNGHYKGARKIYINYRLGLLTKAQANIALNGLMRVISAYKFAQWDWL